MIKNIKINITAALLVAVALGVSSCTEDDTNEPEPTIVPEVNCQLQSVSEIDDNEVWNVAYTYDANGNVLTVTDEDGSLAFEYSGNEITSIKYDDADIAVSYSGGTLPSKLKFVEDEETISLELESSNGRFTKMETYITIDGQDVLSEKTTVAYTTDGNVIEVVSEEYDFETETLTETSRTDNISTDNKKNPYTTSTAIMLLQLLDGDDANLGVNNLVTATYTFDGTSTSVSNSFEYNENDYPTKRVETGFSSPTTYNFTYKCD